MASIFSEWNLEDAKKAAALATDRAKELKSYQDFLNGLHWQDWDGWTGPVPLSGDPDYAEIRTEIERGFVSHNVIGEVVGRHCNGVLGRDVKWQVVPKRKLGEDERPKKEEQERIDEATDWLNVWVEDRKLNQEYDAVGRTLGYAGIAYQRPFVAPGELDERGNVPSADVPTNLDRIYVHFPQPGEAIVYTDPRTQRKCSIYLYKEAKDKRPSEMQEGEGDERAELTYLNGDKTIIRIVGVGVEEQTEFAYALGRRLLMSNMQRRPLINPQVVSQQKLLNKTLSMKSRNMDMAGFRERVTINAQMGGSYQTVDGERVFVPHTLPVGPGSMTSLTGYVLRDADGNEQLATPGMQWLDPVPVTTFLETEHSAYTAILAECNQLHYAISGDATASGESRKVAMSAYLIDLLQTKQQIDQGWAWLLETVLALAATLSGQVARYDDLRVSAEASVDAGPIGNDMLQTTMSMWQNGMLDIRTALTWSGVEDVEAVISAIAAEQAERLAMFPETTPDEQEFGVDRERAIEELEGA